MFQYSTISVLDKTTTAAWTTESALEYWSMTDSLGNRSRVAQICVGNVLGVKERRYYVMQQVRLLDSYGVVIFLGRIMNVDPVFHEGKIILTCRDYLGDLSDKIVSASKSDGSYTASSRNWLIKELLEAELESPRAGGDIDKPLIPRLLQDSSNYLEKITKTYAQRGAYGSITDGVAGNYQYRGTKTVLEAISEIASEDSQQDLVVLSYANTAVLSDITSTNHISDPKTYPSTYWVDYTAGLQDGNEWFPTPRQVSNVSTPNAINGSAQDILYIGSNSKFDGLEYTFRQSGSTVHESNYTTLVWQYWNGEEWKTFIPDKDALFKQDKSVTDQVIGSTVWSTLIHDDTNTHDDLGQISYATSGQGMKDWEKRDLAENYDMPHFNDWNDDDNSGWRNWRAPWQRDTYYNIWYIPNGTNQLYVMNNDSFTSDVDLKTDSNAWMTATNTEPLIRDGDKITISGLDPDTANINAFNGTWFARYSMAGTYVGNEAHKITLYASGYAGKNDRDTDEWSSATAKTNGTGVIITQASVASNAASEARVTISSSTRPTDMKSDAISSVNRGGLTSTYKYWVRAWVKAAATTPAVAANIATLDTATKPRIFRDFRAEDPKFFDEVWVYDTSGRNVNLYTTPITSGGVWISQNTLAGNSGEGEPLLWDMGRNETTFLDDYRKAWYFGADEPFNGIELHAVQGRSFSISSITAANPALITISDVHQLANNDYVLITGSNSGVSIDGYHQITRNQVALINEGGGIGNSEVEFDVDASHGLTPTDTILVGSEYMKVLTVSSNTITVERGLFDTSIVSHSDNDPVFNASKFTVAINTSSGAAGTAGIVRTGVPDYSNSNIAIDILDPYSKEYTLQSYGSYGLPHHSSAWRTLLFDDETVTWTLNATPGDIVGITNHGPLAPLGPTRWRLDTGRSTDDANHWYTEIRFNTEVSRDSITQVDTTRSPDHAYLPWNIKNNIAQPEFDSAYAMSDSLAMPTRTSMFSPYAHQSEGFKEFTIDSIKYNIDTSASYKKDAPNAGQLLDGGGSEFSSAGEDRFIVVGITTQDDAGAVVPTKVTYGGQYGTELIKAEDQTVGTVNASVWYLQAPEKETEDDDARFYVTCATAADHITAHVLTLFGVDQELPVGAASKATVTSQYPTAMAGTAVGDIVFNVVAINSNTSAAEGTNTVEIGTAGGETTGATHRAAAGYEVATGTTTTVDWELGASAAWASVALPIKVSKAYVRIEVAEYNSSGDAAYGVKQGDLVVFRITPGTHADGGWDGVYKVVEDSIRGQTDTFDFDMREFGVNFTGVATGQVTINAVSVPPNMKSLHWARIRTDQSSPIQEAQLRAARTSSVARFKYFDRSKEPWLSSRTLTPGGSSTLQDLDAVYYYDKDRLAVFNATASYASNRAEIFRISPTDGYALIQTKAADTASALDHYLQPGDWVEILGAEKAPTSGSSFTQLNGIWKVMYVYDATRFVVNLPLTGGTAQYNAGTDNAPYVYISSFTDYTAEASADTVSRELFIKSVPVAAHAEIFTTEDHNLKAGDAVVLGLTLDTNPVVPNLGTTGSPDFYRIAEITSDNSFIIEKENGALFAITTAGYKGSIRTAKSIVSVTAASPAVITTANAHGFNAGQRVYFNEMSNGSPTLNAKTHLIKEVLSPVTFTVAVNTTQATTANTGYVWGEGATILESFSAGNSPNGLANLIQANDAVYFGSRHPFTQLRFNFESRLAGFGLKNGYLTRTWEYFLADRFGKTEGWRTNTYFDPSAAFQGRSGEDDVEVSLHTQGFGTWKTTNPGVTGSSHTTYVAGVAPQTVVGGSLDSRIGKHLYYQRARISALAAAAGGGATPVNTKALASRIWCGPNIWNRDREVGTLSGVDSDRHATELETFGLTLDDRQKSLNDGSSMQVLEYSLKDKAFDFVNRVTIRGRAGAYATVDDTESINFYRIVKEKVVEDSSLLTDTQCFQRAAATLEQLKPRKPLTVMAIEATDPVKITTGGETKYHLWSSDDAVLTTTAEALDATETDVTVASNGTVKIKVGSVIVVDDGSDLEQMLVTTVNSTTLLTVTRGVNGSTAVAHDTGANVYHSALFKVFQRKGFKIVANSRGVRETADDGTGTPVTNADVPTNTNNFTYVTTDEDHGLSTGDIVLVTNYELLSEGHSVEGGGRWIYGGVDSTQSYWKSIIKVYVISPRQFKWTTTGGTTAYGLVNDAVGASVHVPAKTGLRVGDQVRIVGHAANHNGLRTVVTSADEGATVSTTYTTSPVGHDVVAGYLLASTPHNLNTGDRVLLRNSSSIPSVDGYREVTRLNDTQFTMNVDLSSGKAGISGIVRPTSIREATITIRGWPIYVVNGYPKSLRAGDMVEVTLENAGVYGETWLCYSINNDGVSGNTKLTLFRDPHAVAEPGDQSRKMLRDLSTRVRETANAVFQPIDKSVESGLDFLPEGPGRSSSRLEYGKLGSTDIDTLNPAGVGDYEQTFPDDFRLSFKMYENFATREKVGTDLLRIDGQGLRPDGTGDAQGGAGLTLISRSKTGETGATADFHPAANEATMYLRQGRTFNITSVTAANPAVITTDAVHGLTTSDYVLVSNTNSGAADSYSGLLNGTWKVNTVPSTTTFSIDTNNGGSSGSVITNAGTVKVLTTGNGLYLANRGIWNAERMYSEWDHDTPAMQQEIFTGFSGFVQPHTDGKALIHLPSLDSIPHIFLTVCSADSSASDQYIANITGWRANDIGATSFAGTGANDMTVTYNGFHNETNNELSFRVQVDATGTPDTFKWSDNRVSAATRNVWNAATVSTSTSAVTLNNNITVEWNATTGHVVGDYWDFDAQTTLGRKYTNAEITVFDDAGSAVNCATGDVHVMYMVVFNSSRAQDSLNTEVDGINRSGFSVDHNEPDSGHQIQS